ncbi:MAG: (2Fe-2S)-binding protein [Flavobacterium sp.]
MRVTLFRIPNHEKCRNCPF